MHKPSIGEGQTDDLRFLDIDFKFDSFRIYTKFIFLVPYAKRNFTEWVPMESFKIAKTFIFISEKLKKIKWDFKGLETSLETGIFYLIEF